MTHVAPTLFVSYTKVDVDWGEWIAWQLKEAGYGVVFQRWHFRPGGNWMLAMHNAATTAQRTVLVLSPDSLEAPHVQQEIAAALAEDPTGSKRKLVPIRIRECSPGGLLRTVGYIDLVGLTEEQARAALIRGMADEVEIPSPAPFPGLHKANAAAPVPFPGTSSPGAEAPPDLSTLRSKLAAALDDAQFDAFCVDHFPSVYQRFSRGMDRDSKTTMLLDYCRRTQTLGVLQRKLAGEVP